MTCNRKFGVFCDICFEPRTPNDHQYTNLCDDTCNECYETRVAPHKFDSPCDSTCGLCGLTRTAPHKFDNDCDEECNICGDIREVEHKSKYVLDTKANFEQDGTAHYECEKCGEPAANRLCKACSFIEELGGDI